ncbi:MAG: PD40 domain-containing protein, partial [Myxococcales bacterium]|nr:PD40 domain-containing protein [Myxococcales bacterium]
MSKARRPGALLIALALASCTRSETAAPGFSPPEPGIVKPCDPCTDAKDKDKEQWDVMHPPGEAGDLGVDVTIDTIEGTWMSVDVSPDGRDVVFDLLGDLYVIPISGGQAKAITSGMAWDMQPRFSPDGQWIAFTSDRGGGDNVWVVRRDGSDARAVTEEDFRLVNSPVWSPDGRFLAVRKHFTKHRSLGAGEIWLYHASGGKGVPLTEKENDQKDVGEPAFSPDGRYLAFTSMARDGYESDQNRLMVLDRESGAVRRVDDWDESVGGFAWLPDGSGFLLSCDWRGAHHLFRLPLAGGAPVPITKGRMHVDGVAPAAGGEHAFALRMTTERPNELVRVTLGDGKVEALTDVNGAVFADLALPTVEERWFEATDGERIHAWIVKPPGFDPSKRYPMLTYCQGGPQSQVGQWFSFRWNFHLM